MKNVLFLLFLAITSIALCEELVIEPGPNDTFKVTVRGETFLIRHEKPAGKVCEYLRIVDRVGTNEGFLQFTRTANGVHLDSVRSARFRPGAGHALQGLLLSAFSDRGPIHAELAENNLARFVAVTWKDRSPSIEELSANVPFFAFDGFDYHVIVSGDEVFVDITKKTSGASTLNAPLQISDQQHSLLRKRILESPQEHWGSVTPRQLTPSKVRMAPHCPLEQLLEAG